jgi:hypothetical protein
MSYMSFFYALSDDTSYFSNERTWKFTIFDNIKFYNKIKEKRVGRSSQEKLGRTTSRIVMLDIKPTIWGQNGFAPRERK